MVDQALPRVGLDQAFHQAVDGRVLEADEVAAAGLVGAAGMPELSLFVAWRVGLRPGRRGHVEIPRAQAVDELRDVDATDLHVDAKFGQVALERQDDPFHVGLEQHELEAQWLAVGTYHAVVLDPVAGLGEQLVGLAPLLADHPAAVIDRILEDLVEGLVGNLAAQRFEDLQLGFAGQLVGGHLRVLEIAVGALVGAEEQLLVRPFEVEQQADRLAYPAVLEHRAADIEGEALHPHRVVVVDAGLDEAPVAQCRRLVAGGPVLRRIFEVDVVLAGLEGFQGDRHVAIGVDGDGVEVIESAGDRKVLGPPVLDSLVADGASRIDLGDAVGAAAHRNFHAGLGKVAVGPPVFRQDRDLPEDQRQFAVAGVLEVEAHAKLVLGDHLVDVRIVVAVHRVALAHQRLEGEHHVFGGDRRAIAETGLGAQVEAHVAVVRCLLDLLREQAVFGERLVLRLEGQGVVDQAQRRGRDALADERVKAVEAAEVGLAEDAAFRRIRIHVVEMLEIGGILRRLIVERQCMFRGGEERAAAAEQQGCQQRGEAGTDHRDVSRFFCHHARRPRV